MTLYDSMPLDSGRWLPYRCIVVERCESRYCEIGNANFLRSVLGVEPNPDTNFPELSPPSAFFWPFDTQSRSFELSCRLFVRLSGRQGSGVKLPAPEQQGTHRRWLVNLLPLGRNSCARFVPCLGNSTEVSDLLRADR